MSGGLFLLMLFIVLHHLGDLAGLNSPELALREIHKVQASIQGSLLRVSGKSRDLLQEVIQLLKGLDFGLELQFTNYRTF